MIVGKNGLTVILGLILAAQAPVAGADKKRQKNVAPSSAPAELVWPPPPEKPRIRYVGQITGERDFKGQKSSWKDRVAGQKRQQEQLFLRRPYGVAIGSDDRIYIADSAQQAIVVFDRNTHAIATWKGNGQIPLSLPVGLALDAQSRLFVSDTRLARVVVFGPEGKPVMALGAKLMKRPTGVAVDDRRGRLYVGDILLHKVLVYDLKTFELLKQIGGPVPPAKPGPDTFYTPTNMAVARDGRLFVVDTLQCRVFVFNENGQFIRAFGERGDRPGNFTRPKGIALDTEGHVYVVDAAFGNIQIFNPDGRLLLSVGSGGEAPGQFSLPTGIAIDGENRIYVAEHWTMAKGRLQMFRYLPELTQQIAADRKGEEQTPR